MVKQTIKQAQSGWEDYVKNFLADVEIDPEETPEEKQRRIARLESDPVAWCRYYFPKYCSSPFAAFHIRAIRRIVKNTNTYEVWPWARELAKSAIAMFVILYLALTGQIKCLLLVSATEDSAKRLLEPYMIELMKNPRIRNDYGEQVVFGKWEEGNFVAKCGCAFRALGAGNKPRGTRNENIRPDFILVDDIDTDEEVRNPDRITDKWEWIEGALIPTTSVNKDKRILFVGNIIGNDTTITRAMTQADYAEIVNIRDKNNLSTWPEKNSEEAIDRQLALISFAAGQKEYFNNPISEGDVFKAATWGKCPPLRRFPFLVAYADPATSNRDKKSSCTKALILLGFLDGKYYVLNARVDHATTDAFIQWFYDLRDYVGGAVPVYYYIENNGLQNPFYEQVFLPKFAERGKSDGNSIGVTPDARNKGDKFTRIEGTLEPLVRNAALVFNEAEAANPHMKRLETQFLTVTPKLSAPCDGVDATEGGVYIIREKLASWNTQITYIPLPRSTKRY